MKLGKSAQTIFAQTHTLEASSGSTFYTLGFLVALILWSFGLVWLFFASASIARCRSFPFNIGWWGFTFPLGVFAASTCQMGRELPSEFFKMLGIVADYFALCSGFMDGGEHWDVEGRAVRDAVLCAMFGRSKAEGGG